MKTCFETLYKYARHSISMEDQPFFTYFTCSFYADVDHLDRPCFHVSAYTSYSKYMVFDFVYDYQGHITFSSSFGKEENNLIISLLITKLISDDKEAFRRACDDFDESTKDIEKQEQTRYFNDSLTSLFEEIDDEELASSVAKASIEVYLSDNKTSFVLDLKIGRNKFYKITNIQKFLDRFATNESYKYGKDLELYHYLSSFDERSQKIINILLQEKCLVVYNIGSRLADKLLNACEGSVVYCDNCAYKVSSNALPVKIHIRSDYSMEIQGIPEDFHYFTDNYYINDVTGVICKLTDNQRINKVVGSVLEYPLASVEKNLDSFRYSFFLKYPEYFTYDVMIADKVELPSLKLRTYFDYENETISYKLRIFKEENEVTRGSINNAHEIQFLNRYDEILSKMGFNSEAKMESQSDVWNFLYGSLENIKKYSEIYLSDSLANKQVVTFAPPSITIRKSENGSMLEVFMSDTQYDKDELYAILDAIRKKKKFVLLKDQFISVAGEDAKKFSQMAEDFDILDQKTIHDYTTVPLYYAFKAFSGDDSSLEMDDFVTNTFEEVKNFKDADIQMPKINGTLRSYQAEGVRWLSILYKYSLGGILADDMGLGKTIETISFLKLVQPKAPCLIVCPKSLVFNWESEFQKFDPATKTIPLLGTADERKRLINAIKEDEYAVYFISYDSLRNEIENLKDIHFDTCILDEAQFIKNVNAKKTNAVKSITSDHFFALTGTPIENDIQDLWSIFDFLMPHYFLDLKEFKSAFENNEDYYKIVRQKAAPFILRRNKKDVLTDLPDKYEVIYSVEMTANQKKIYDAYKLKAKEILAEAGKGKIMQALAYLTRLRQICVDPGLFVEGYNGGSGKTIAIKDIVQNKINEGHRILLFSQFVTALNGIEQVLIQEQVPYRMITGDTSAKDRTAICNEFNANPSIKVVLISLKAGGTGLNLTGADTVIHLDPWWNLAAQNQASDRAHRIGQTRNVEIIRLICEDSVEQRVIQLQNEKKELVEKMISENDEEIRNLSVSDLKDILTF